MHWIYAHLIGDYLLQNDYIARGKKKPGAFDLFTACVSLHASVPVLRAAVVAVCGDCCSALATGQDWLYCLVHADYRATP